MRANITKSNRKRLASLTALGAGAMAATGTAYGSSIVYSGILDERVGFPLGSRLHATLTGPNGVAGIIRAFSYTGPQHSAIYGERLSARAGANGTKFLALGNRQGAPVFQNVASGLPINFNWGTAVVGRKSLNKGLLAIYSYNYGSSSKAFKFTSLSAKNRYILFEFTGGKLARNLYGWAQLTVAFTHGDFPHPTVTLVDWAYDTSGAQIPAGDTGTPEPSTLALTGLAALALGARGLRTWRASRVGIRPKE